MEIVFQRSREANVKLKPSICEIGGIHFLGHVTTEDEAMPDPERIRALKEFPVPKSVCELRGLLRLAHYYKGFVKDYAKIAVTLNRLTAKKGNSFQYGHLGVSKLLTLSRKL